LDITGIVSETRPLEAVNRPIEDLLAGELEARVAFDLR
jgi:hypothetical protein